MKSGTQQGFTLVELMIVVVIAGILAAIGVPSYQQHVVKSKRAAAQAFMLQAANKEEQIILDMRSYAAVAANANFGSAPATGIGLAVPGDVAANYNLVITVPSTTSYVITATPTGAQLTNDGACSPLTLNQTGAKSPASGCW